MEEDHNSQHDEHYVEGPTKRGALA